jgi:hypothetical protein
MSRAIAMVAQNENVTPAELTKRLREPFGPAQNEEQLNKS